MLDSPPRLRCPGLFVTGTDTGVGKTVVTCALAAALREQGARRVGVMKPLSTGCRRDREGLVSEDAEALAFFADARHPLDVINPVRFQPPLAPAVAAEATGQSIDFREIWRNLAVIDAESDVMLVEGVGGAMVPIDPDRPRVTVLDLAAAVGYPVLVVARAGLGTLSHTALTVRALQSAGLRVTLIAMNGYEPDVARASDPSMASNRVWLEKLTGVKVLPIPQVPPDRANAARGVLDRDIIEAATMTWWPDVLDRQTRPNARLPDARALP